MTELRGISGSTGCTLRPSWTWIEIYHQVAMAGTRNSQLVIKLAAISRTKSTCANAHYHCALIVQGVPAGVEEGRRCV